MDIFEKKNELEKKNQTFYALEIVWTPTITMDIHWMLCSDHASRD